MTTTIPLGELVEIKGGGTPSRSVPDYWGGPIPWATVKDFKSTILDATLESITLEGVASSATTIVPAGSIIVPTRMAVGKAAINTIDMAINQDLKAIMPREGVDRYFLLHFLLSKAEYLECRAQGATVKGIKLELLRSLPFPDLSLKDQRRIAKILERADGIRRKRLSARACVDELIKSEFVARFGSPLSNRKDLPTAPIKHLAKVVTGNTPPRRDLDNYGEAIEWIKSDNINTPSHFLSLSAERLSEQGKRVGRVAPAGSTLITCIAGSPRVIGNAALANREVAFNQQINALIPNKETDPFFLYSQMLVGKSLVQESSTKSMKGMVSKGKLQEIVLLRPNHQEQVEFGKFFSRMMKLSCALDAASQASEKLFLSLSQLAFSGRI